MSVWGIWCETWGGVTGSRLAWLKSSDGMGYRTFPSREAAEAAKPPDREPSTSPSGRLIAGLHYEVGELDR